MGELVENGVHVPVIFGGDSNVYYGGKKGLEKIKELQKDLKKKGLEYTLVIAKYLVRKFRPFNFFRNAQAAYKTEETKQETMFFAFPKDMKMKVDHKFDDVLDEKANKEIVCAFAGADHTEKTWRQDILSPTLSCK